MVPGVASAEGFTRNDLNSAAGDSTRSAHEATRSENPEASLVGALRGLND